MFRCKGTNTCILGQYFGLFGLLFVLLLYYYLYIIIIWFRIIGTAVGVRKAGR
jgi:hypothetical protein